MKRIIILMLMLVLVTGCSLKNMFVRENKVSEYLTGKHNVEIKVKDYGIIKVELDADTAQITVTNFIELVNEKFYDGLTFNRIIEGFMIQGGDPDSNGNGGRDETIKCEFISNGITNNISHTRGVISMARGGDDYDSASSQFFIMHKDYTSLDGYYAAFGHVTDGMKVVDKIAKITSEPDSGFVDYNRQPVIEYIKVIENNQE